MAKRKPTPAKRQARKRKREDSALLRRYARHCYQTARREKAEESGIPLRMIGVRKAKNHAEVIAKTEAAIRAWFEAMDPLAQTRARAKIRSEIAPAV